MKSNWEMECPYCGRETENFINETPILCDKCKEEKELDEK